MMPTPVFTSYAQNFEDVMLWRALAHVENGFYVDIGAQHPLVDSVSLAFHERGWRGVHVEPGAACAELLRQARPGDTVIEAAVGVASAALPFYEIDGTGFSTCDARVARWHAASGLPVTERLVRSVTLAEVLGGCSGREIHWLKIDVEGAEEQVLASWRPAGERPWIVVVESRRPDGRADCAQDWEPDLLELGYQFAYFDGLNRFYVSASQAGLAAAFVCGPNVFDDFALSGTSSAPFCAIFHQRLATDHAAYRRVLDEQRDRLSQHAENLQAAHQVDLDAWDRERASTKEYVDSILSWGRTSEAYAKSLEEERGKLYAAQKESDQRIAFLEESLERCRTTDAAVRK